MMAEDYFDTYEDESGDQPSRTKTCNNCNKSGLSWENDNNKWVLLERSGRIHKCKTKVVAISLDAKLK